MKNRKEFIVTENSRGKIYRVSKKLRISRRGGGRSVWAEMINVHINKTSFSIRSCIYDGSARAKGFITFRVSKNKIIPIVKLGTHYKCSYTQIPQLKSFKKGISAKINRILNKEYGLKFKVTKSLYENIVAHNSKIYNELFPNGTGHMLAVLSKPTFKQSVKSYCGFSGKKLISDLAKEPENYMREKLDMIKMFKKHLTFGDIHVPHISIQSGMYQLKESIQGLIKINPKLLRQSIFLKEPKSPAPITNRRLQGHWATDSPLHYITDTWKMYLILKAKIDDIENSDYGFSKAKDLIKYHDMISLYIMKMKEPNVDFPKYDFDGIEIGDFKLVVCKDYYTLIEWSTFMSNCVSSYKYSILEGRCVICGLFKGEELVYNLSLSPTSFGVVSKADNKDKKIFDIDQLNARYNRGYDQDDYNLIESKLGEANVLRRKVKSPRLKEEDRRGNQRGVLRPVGG